MSNPMPAPVAQTTANIPPMQVKARIHSIKPEGGLRARVSLELGGCFAIRGVKLMDGVNGYFLAMPSYKVAEGYKDICFPVTKDFRDTMLNTVVKEYEQMLSQTQLTNHRSGSQEQSTHAAPEVNTGQQMASM